MLKIQAFTMMVTPYHIGQVKFKTEVLCIINKNCFILNSEWEIFYGLNNVCLCCLYQLHCYWSN
jgi:hypothetical protein